MMQTEALYQAVLAAFNQQRTHDDDPAASARAFTSILCAFAALIAPPAIDAVAGELIAFNDPTPAKVGELIALQARSNELLTTLCQHQDDIAALADATMRFPPRRTARRTAHSIPKARAEISGYDAFGSPIHTDCATTEPGNPAKEQ